MSPAFTAMQEGSEFPRDSANYTCVVPGIVSKAVTNQWNKELKTGDSEKAGSPWVGLGCVFWNDKSPKPNASLTAFISTPFLMETPSNWRCLNTFMGPEQLHRDGKGSAWHLPGIPSASALPRGHQSAGSPSDPCPGQPNALLGGQLMPSTPSLCSSACMSGAVPTKSFLEARAELF